MNCTPPLQAHRRSAFTADSFAQSEYENGDAEIRIDYTPTWLKHVAVFSRIAEPEKELLQALERNDHKSVEVRWVTTGSALFIVESLVSSQTVHKRYLTV
ncbi:hypothetical protein [Methanocalculus sp.]|uniref:hypothetical protein n=1 Tax=Methanocalculus sp. TaxID=2004547 RepID=UPI002721A73F|nr:hypothetical protein [Methanocalculus sp.]MDO8842091.1 hypothetical protein [Methanocalculus sp.]